MKVEERYDAESLSATEWRRQANKFKEQADALSRENDRLKRKLADVTHTVTQIRRDLYWHVDALEKTLHP